MKKLLFVLLAMLCVLPLFAKSYSEYLTEAEKYESKKEWIYALGAYYNAMKASDNPEKASQKYKEISECIKAGNPGLGTFNVFSMHDEWVNLIKNSERYFTENFPYTIKYENLKYDSADYEKKTATYKLSLIVNKSDFYNAIIDILRTGYNKTDHKDWKDIESQYKTLWFMEDFYTGVHKIGSWESTNFTNTFTTSVYNTNYNKLKTVDEYENLKSDADRIYKNYGVALAYFASVLTSYKYSGISVNETPAFAACFSAIDGVNNITLIDWYGETKLSVPIFKSGKKTGYDIKLGIYDNDNKLIIDGTRQTLCIDEFKYQFANISQDKMAILDSGNYHIGLIGIWLNYGLFDILSLTEDDFTNGTIRGIIKPLPDIKLAIDNVDFIDKGKLDEIERKKQEEIARQEAERKAELARQEAERKRQEELARQEAERKRQEELARQELEIIEYIAYQDCTISDDISYSSLNNGDSKINPGEIIKIDVRIKNSGTSLAKGITAVLSTTEKYVSILEPSKTYGDIARGYYKSLWDVSTHVNESSYIGEKSTSNSELNASCGWEFSVDRNAPDNTVIPFTLTFNDIYGGSKTESFELAVTKRDVKIVYDAYTMGDVKSYYSKNNGDGKINPGEVIKMDVRIKNSGTSLAKGITAVLSTTEKYVSILEPSKTYGDIARGYYKSLWDVSTHVNESSYIGEKSTSNSELNASYGWQFSVDKNTPRNTVIPFTLTFTDTYGNSWTGSFRFTVQ